MTVATYEIVGNDFEGAGRASRALKEHLKRIGVEAAAIRRALIAAYEAESNVVIHAHKGWLRAYFGPGQLDVEVEDEGPGVPDIDLAMKDGFSTATAAARELGFGAGMGLPNIRKNSDRFAIQSTVGRGTRVQFTIRYRPQDGAGAAGHSLRVDPKLCRRCLDCLRACPTLATRVRAGGPEILEHLCIDCTACIAVCKTGALTMRGADDALPAKRAGLALVVPRALFAQFGPETGPRGALAALDQLGFPEVHALDPWERTLGDTVAAHARERASSRPVVSAACPAVVNLVAMRFPSLLENVAPFVTPIEAARETLGMRPVAFVPLCPGLRTALTSTMAAGNAEIVSPRSLLRELAVVLGKHRPAPGTEIETVRALGAGSPTGLGMDGVLTVTGIRRVERVLDKAENGLLADLRILDLWACEGGCFGSPFLREEPSIARHRASRWREASRPEPAIPAAGVRRGSPPSPRPGLRLDPDMAIAVGKLGEIDRLSRRLPGRDCGVCGAPTCMALAEDVVLGRASVEACVYRAAGEEKTT